MDLGITPKVKPLIEAVRIMIEEDIRPQENYYFDEVGKSGSRFEYTSRMTDIMENLKESQI